MNCTHCGEKIPDEAKFCQNCGKMVVNQETDLAISDSETVKLIPAKCTNCGGNLTVDPAKKSAVCPYCDLAFIVDEAINNYNIDTVEGNINIGNATINVNQKSVTEQYYICPNCHSANIQKLSVVYNEGHTDIDFRSKDTSWSNSKEYRTKGVQETKLAASAAPPREESYLGAILCVAFLYVIVRVIVSIVFAFLISKETVALLEKFVPWGINLIFVYLLFICLRNVHAYQKRYPQMLDEWKHSWICKKCGHVFIKDDMEETIKNS